MPVHLGFREGGIGIYRNSPLYEEMYILRQFQWDPGDI
jgi:hypothetical protein